MNFFPMKVQKSGENLYVDNGVMNIKLPKEVTPTYEKLVGKEVIFGIRPDDIHNPDFAPANIHGETVEATVDVTELMGNEIYVYLMNGGNNFVARVDPRSRYKIGEKVNMLFNMDNFHIFDPSDNPDNPVAIR